MQWCRIGKRVGTTAECAARRTYNVYGSSTFTECHSLEKIASREGNTVEALDDGIVRSPARHGVQRQGSVAPPRSATNSARKAVHKVKAVQSEARGCSIWLYLLRRGQWKNELSPNGVAAKHMQCES